MDYLLCGNLPYPAWKKHISVQNLSNRRIRRYLVCRLKRPEARGFSHVRFTYVVAGERKRVIFITLFLSGKVSKLILILFCFFNPSNAATSVFFPVFQLLQLAFRSFSASVHCSPVEAALPLCSPGQTQERLWYDLVNFVGSQSACPWLQALFTAFL